MMYLCQRETAIELPGQEHWIRLELSFLYEYHDMGLPPM